MGGTLRDEMGPAPSLNIFCDIAKRSYLVIGYGNHLLVKLKRLSGTQTDVFVANLVWPKLLSWLVERGITELVKSKL